MRKLRKLHGAYSRRTVLLSMLWEIGELEEIMSELFHMTNCLVQLPNGEDRNITVQIPGGMGQSETLAFWARLENEWDAATIEPIDRQEHRLLWRT